MFNTLWNLHINRVLSKEVIKFIVTGFINTLFGYLLYAFFFWLTGSKTIALIFNYSIGIFFNYKTYSLLVFNSGSKKVLTKFILAYGTTLLINYISLFIYCDLLKINPYFAQIITLSYVTILLFFLLKMYVFKTQS